jgi:hypothetical protein
MVNLIRLIVVMGTGFSSIGIGLLAAAGLAEGIQSLGGDIPEAYRPCSWQWFYSHSSLIKDERLVKDIGNTFREFVEVLAYSDVRKWDKYKSDKINVKIHDDAEHGDNWVNAKKGNGFYCHCSQIDENLINIEYWVLFGYNRPTKLSRWVAHKGDLICIEMVFNKADDQIIRVAFNIHGCVIEAFDIIEPENTWLIDLKEDYKGLNLDGNPTSINVKKIRISSEKRYQSGEPQWYQGYYPADPVLYFAQDKETKWYDHLIVFLEWGTHEPWPNDSGGFFSTPKHNGTGYSFIPKSVTVLDPCIDEPFMYFGGHIGDPVGPMRHRSWYIDDNTIKIPQDALKDEALYTQLGPLSWPPKEV